MQLGLFKPVSEVDGIGAVIDIVAALNDEISAAIPAEKKALLSQYFTPMAIAKQMATMVQRDDIRDIGDHGAGTGILSSTLIAMKSRVAEPPFHVKAYEIDDSLHGSIKSNIELLNEYLAGSGSGSDAVAGDIREDFTDVAGCLLAGRQPASLDAIVLNPPYQKLNQKTDLAKLFRYHGIPVPNLYAVFIVLSVLMLRTGGELVAIVPRSFCNGDYYKVFRKWLLASGSIDWFVRYKRRSNCFKADNVLQENVIFRFTKNVKQSPAIRVSLCDDPEQSPEFEGLLPATDVLHPDSGAIHIPSSNGELAALHDMSSRQHSFAELGLVVGTGKLELNRMEQHMGNTGSVGHAPVVYAQHWSNNELSLAWHDQTEKPCYLRINDVTRKKCVAAGRYILVKRISANDDRSGRCNPCVVRPGDIPGDYWAIDNHIQVISIPDTMTDDRLESIVCDLVDQTTDDFLKVVSGTTQLNCNDIRKLRFNALDK